MYYNPWMMNPMGGGMMYDAQAGAQPEGGAQRDGYGWRASRREQQGQLNDTQTTLANAQDRYAQMQERFKAGSSRRQQVMQPRMDAMSNRIDRLQGKLDAGEGADRLGMGWRKERRQAKRDGSYDPNAQQGQNEMSMMPQGWMNGMPGGMGYGGMGYGGYGGFPQMFGGMMPQMQYGTQESSAPQGGATPVAPYNPQAPAPQSPGGTPAQLQNMYLAGQFNSPYGQLVQASGGAGNLYRQLNGDESTLFYYSPQQSWMRMTNAEYRGYDNPADFYQDPNQYAPQAGGIKQDWVMKNGMWQGAVGSGAYA